MTPQNFLFTTLISFFLTSCISTSYFQVYKTIPSDKMLQKDNQLIYEDENCKILYNLWSEGGDVGFRFYNKTEKNIYLNLEESFFVLNGISYNYYKNRIFTSSASTGSTATRGISASKSLTGINFQDLLQTNRLSATSVVGTTSSMGFSVTYNEDKIVCVPSKTSKIIKEYTINESLFRDCALFKYPSTKQVKTIVFTKSESPFVFSNRIAYTIAKSDNSIKIENDFYVSEITNYPESEILGSKSEEYCGQKSMLTINYFKIVSADKFYIKYKKGQDIWKH